MSSTPLTVAVSAADITTAYAPFYTVPGNVSRAGIDAVVLNNYSALSATYSIRLVQLGTGTVLNEVITNKNIRSESNDLAPEIIGQALNSGAELQIKASANDSINAAITVTLVTD